MGLSSEAAPSYKNQQMLQLLWSVLNIAVFLGTIFVGYKTTVFIRKKVNLFFAILFALALLSFVNAADKSSEISSVKSELVSGTPGRKGFDQTKLVYVTLQKDLLLHIDLAAYYGRYNDSLGLYPINAGSTITGLVAGYKWIPSKILLDTAAGKIRYHFSGILDWKLLGITFYAQEKYFTGLLNP